ncbi:hypothetical protein LBMAG42_14610 [Deltaproteobacteria bacterium]|nr:hypothetical protein LBMAG42_14610 [Deltaproteobacteria bacterium]
MLLVLSSFALAAAPAQASLPRGNVLILVVDTLRADAMGTYGEKSPTTPRLDTFAKEAVVFDRAWTQYTWTLPSFISYTTSRFVRSHGWDYEIGQFDQYETVDSSVPTLAQVLQANGYATEGRYANGHLETSLGFGKGFDTWAHGKDDAVIAGAIADIKGWATDGKPNLLYVHVMQCHTPWRPTADAQKALGTPLTVPAQGLDWNDWPKLSKEARPARATELRTTYEAALWDADASMGRILDTLAASGEAKNTMVVFHSDHGEQLGDHNFAGHNRSVFEELAHVPLMVRVPGAKPARVSDRVGRLLDVPPTVLDVPGLAAKQPGAWQGSSWYRQTSAQLAVVERTADIAFTLDGVTKLLQDRATATFAFGFNLATDPGEKARLKDATLPALAALELAAKDWYARTPKGTNNGEKPKVDAAKKEEVNDLLKELGYIE